MSLKGKRLYHGTSKKIKGEYLTPSKACRVFSNGKKITRCDRIPKVYTTTNINVAALFAANIPTRDAEILKKNKVIFYLRKKDLTRLKGPGYIYEVDTKGFKKGPRTKYNEYINKKQVQIIKKVRIANLYEYIMKDKNIMLLLEDRN